MRLVHHKPLIKGTNMNFELKENHVRTAVDRVGGPTKASNLIGVSNNTVNSWINKRRINNIDHARTLADASGMSVQDLRETK